MTEETRKLDLLIDDGIADDGTWNNFEEVGKAQRKLKRVMGVKNKDAYCIAIRFGKNSKQNLENQVRKVREKVKQELKNLDDFTEEGVEKKAYYTDKELLIDELIKAMIEDVLENGLSEGTVDKLKYDNFIPNLVHN